MQKELDFGLRDRWIDRLREHARAAGLLPSDISLLAAIAEGDKKLTDCSLAIKTKRSWGCAIGHDGNTALRAMRRLAQRGVLASESTSRGYAVLVDWRAVRDLAHEEISERLRESLDGSGAGLVRLGAGCARVLVKEHVSKTRVLERERVNVAPAAPEPAPEPEPECESGESAAGGQVPERPWARQGGLTNEQLVSAHHRRDQGVLRALYAAGVSAGWWDDCEANRLRYLGCVHHAVRCSDRSPMGLLTQFVRANLRDRSDETPEEQRRYRLDQDDDLWASETRRMWRSRELVG